MGKSIAIKDNLVFEKILERTLTLADVRIGHRNHYHKCSVY